ncbi:hypothetical protein ABNB80_19255 [Paenibacillus larvae]
MTCTLQEIYGVFYFVKKERDKMKLMGQNIYVKPAEEADTSRF